jgi:hypothetical protein
MLWDESADDLILGGAAGLSVNSTALVTGVLTANGGAVFNESGADVDFRVESDTNTHALFVQGSDGFVGIGETSPTHALTVKSQDSGLHGKFYSDFTATELRIESPTVDVIGLYTGTNDALTFGTASTERMRINSSGAIYSLLDGSEGRAFGTLSAASASNYFIQGVHSKSTIVSGGTRSFGVFTNGNVVNTNNSYGAISDAKLKENVVDASPKLADLMLVKVRNYNLIGETTKQIGVVAQELEAVFPSMVDENADRDEDGNLLETTTKGVKYSVFVPMLIKAIQEQQATITALTARITALENA